jgi:uncharacterized repeat protein (TIGR03803 family)
MANSAHRGVALTLAVAFGLGPFLTGLAQAQSLTVLYSFTGSSDGGDPYAGLIRDPMGNLYGTTDYGGTSYAGVVYKIDSSGTESVLYSFTGGSDGAYPFAAWSVTWREISMALRPRAVLLVTGWCSR